MNSQTCPSHAVCIWRRKNDSAQGSKNNIRWKYSLKGVQSIIICFVSIRNLFWPNTTSIIFLFFRSFCLAVFSCPFFSFLFHLLSLKQLSAVLVYAVCFMFLTAPWGDLLCCCFFFFHVRLWHIISHNTKMPL